MAMTDTTKPNPIRLYIDLRLAAERLDAALEPLRYLPEGLPLTVQDPAADAIVRLLAARDEARKRADELRRTDPLLSRELSE